MKAKEILDLMEKGELTFQFKETFFKYDGAIGIVEATAHFGDFNIEELKLVDGRLFFRVRK